MNQRKEMKFKKLYDATYQTVYTYIKRIYYYDESMVEDILQEVYLIAYKKISTLEKHPNQIGWMKRTARNVTYHILEKNHKIDEILFGNEIEFSAGEMEFEPYYEVLGEILKPKELEILIKYYEEGYSLDELAKNHRITKSAMKMRIQRIKNKAKKTLVLFLLFG